MRLLLTPGDPRGVGPEVALKALVGWAGLPVVMVGDPEAVERARAILPAVPDVVRLSDVGAPLKAGVVGLVEPPTGDEAVEVAALRLSVEALLAGLSGALVTGPIHKARLAATGFKYPGHTDFLGHLCGVPRPVMAFVGASVRVALVTVHVPLRAVADALSVELIEHTLVTADRALRDQLGVREPRLLVCGLNPHAGDQGLLGSEEHTIIAPAVQRARAAGVHAEGPVSAETAFRIAQKGGTDMVIAMYHDQGLAPLKLVDFGRSVNWTLGLPMIRTSVDHGTADDIAGSGLADPSSMSAALGLAQRLVHVAAERGP